MRKPFPCFPRAQTRSHQLRKQKVYDEIQDINFLASREANVASRNKCFRDNVSSSAKALREKCGTLQLLPSSSTDDLKSKRVSPL